MFTYCVNNSVIKTDPSGYISSNIYFPVCWGGVGSSLKTGPYDSADDAAKAFSEYFYGASQFIRFEYGTEIYAINTNGKRQYYFNYPTVGGPHGVLVGYPVPQGAEMVAYAHTHPNSILFSSQDINVAKDFMCDAYVVGPRYQLFKYSWLSDSMSYLGKITPRELSSREKVILVFNFSALWEEHLRSQCEFSCISKQWPSS